MKPKQVLAPHSVKGFRPMHLSGLLAWCFKEKAIQESQKKLQGKPLNPMELSYAIVLENPFHKSSILKNHLGGRV
jgi:hypothetical protein